AAPAGLIWKALKAVRSMTAASIIHKTGTIRASLLTQMTPTASSSTHMTFGSTRTGTVWNDITCGYSGGNPRPVHVDQHALAFVPGSSTILAIGNDGGIHGTINANIVDQTTDPTWFNMDTGINTIEFYSGDISGNFANAASPQANGGAQDNGS